ncbi:MAG: contractile injection system protein, VgrG/Pvc8 family [Gammaproteobacteria bacterium]|nr:contractile injection system protein, VgrG/Pvc8 family [Gammaproteobacteria bacterium]
MDYIFNFTLHIDDLPSDAFRLTYIDSQNDGTSQDVEFVVRAFSVNSYDISHWGLKKAKLYLRDELLHDGLLVDGKAYQKDFEGYFYEFILASPFALFKTRGPNRVFVDKNVDEIIDAVFISAGWATAQWYWRLKQALPLLPYRVQYHQSDYDFIVELLSEFNLNFEFKNSMCILSDCLDIKTTTHHVESPQAYIKKTCSKFLGYDFEKAFQEGLFFATVEAPDEQQPYLNQQGHYRIRWDFDKTSTPLEGSSPIPLITPHFLHFPLRKDTRVVVRCLEGKMHQPILIGVVPETDPIPENYVHESYSKHRLTLNPEKILLTHGNQKTSVSLSQNSLLAVPTGILSLVSGKKLIENIQEDCQHKIKNNLDIAIQHNQMITVHNDINFVSGRNFSFSAKQQLSIHTSENMTFHCEHSQFSAEKFFMCADRTIEIGANGVTLLSETIEIQAETLQLGSADSMISMIPAGVVLNVPVLMINAAVISGIKMPP